MVQDRQVEASEEERSIVRAILDPPGLSATA